MSDNGFNDDELADIMNEIESLENSDSSSDDQTSKLEDQIIEFSEDMEKDLQELDGQGSIHLNEIDQMMLEQKHPHLDDEQMVIEQSKEIVEELNPNHSLDDISSVSEESNVVSLKNKGFEKINTSENNPAYSSSSVSSSPVSMNFDVSGQLAMKLRFNFEQDNFTLIISEAEGFKILFDSGAEFSLPLNQGKKRKNVA
jgi:hypothetical protein